jgi:hypothetical protein
MKAIGQGLRNIATGGDLMVGPSDLWAHLKHAQLGVVALLPCITLTRAVERKDRRFQGRRSARSYLRSTRTR